MKRYFMFFALLIVPSISLGMTERPFQQYVSELNMPGYTYVAKFGANPLITAATDPEDIWEGGGVYPDSAYGTLPNIGTADIVSISSSNAADTQNALIFGLGADGYAVTQQVTLQGQTRVALGTPLWRVWRVENWSATSFAGNVYVYSGTANTAGVPSGASVVKAVVMDGNNQTQMAIYTIPRGKVGFLSRSEVGFGFNGLPSAGTEEVQFAFKARTYGKTYKVKKTVNLISTATSEHSDTRFYPDPLPALTDIKLTVVSTTADIDAWGTFHITLVDESELSEAFLQSINQPY